MWCKLSWEGRNATSLKPNGLHQTIDDYLKCIDCLSVMVMYGYHHEKRGRIVWNLLMDGQMVISLRCDSLILEFIVLLRIIRQQDYVSTLVLACSGKLTAK